MGREQEKLCLEAEEKAAAAEQAAVWVVAWDVGPPVAAGAAIEAAALAQADSVFAPGAVARCLIRGARNARI